MDRRACAAERGGSPLPRRPRHSAFGARGFLGRRATAARGLPGPRKKAAEVRRCAAPTGAIRPGWDWLKGMGSGRGLEDLVHERMEEYLNDACYS